MNTDSTTEDKMKSPKLPPVAHVMCGWPLLLVAIGGAIGGGLGGAEVICSSRGVRRTRPQASRLWHSEGARLCLRGQSQQHEN